MSAEELGERLMCSSARVSSHKLRTGSLSPDDHAKLVQAAGVLEKADIFIDDTAGLNMFELRAKARRLQAKSRSASSSSTTSSSWPATAARTTASRRSATSRAP